MAGPSITMRMEQPSFKTLQEGMASLPRTVAEGKREWQAVADMLFDSSQRHAHIITGRMKSSGRDEVRVENATMLIAEVVYGGVVIDGELVDYALYEHERGDSHAFLDLAYEETSPRFPEAMVNVWQRVMVPTMMGRG